MVFYFDPLVEKKVSSFISSPLVAILIIASCRSHLKFNLAARALSAQWVSLNDTAVTSSLCVAPFDAHLTLLQFQTIVLCVQWPHHRNVPVELG